MIISISYQLIKIDRKEIYELIDHMSNILGNAQFKQIGDIQKQVPYEHQQSQISDIQKKYHNFYNPKSSKVTLNGPN